MCDNVAHVAIYLIHSQIYSELGAFVAHHLHLMASKSRAVPRPGFPLYRVIAESHGASVAHYDLLPDAGWECDLDQMEDVILTEESKHSGRSSTGRRVRGILVNNPSNPTGAVYSEKHLAGIVALAQRHQLPIIADEIYGDMTFGDAVFRPLAVVSARMGKEVPVITASGLGKQCESLPVAVHGVVSKHHESRLSLLHLPHD